MPSEMKNDPTSVSKQLTRYEWQVLTKDPFGQTRFSVAAELFTCTCSEHTQMQKVNNIP